MLVFLILCAISVYFICYEGKKLNCSLCAGKTFVELETMKERFSKLLLGEDMSGSGKGVCTAVAISNAMTNLYGMFLLLLLGNVFSFYFLVCLKIEIWFFIILLENKNKRLQFKNLF